MDICNYPEYIRILPEIEKRILIRGCIKVLTFKIGNIDKAMYIMSYYWNNKDYDNHVKMFKNDIQDRFNRIRNKQMIKFDSEDMKKFFNTSKKSILLDLDCPIYKKIINFQKMIDTSYIARMRPHIEIIKNINDNKYEKLNKLLDILKTNSLNKFERMNNAYVLDLGDNYHITIMYGYNHCITDEIVGKAFY